MPASKANTSLMVARVPSIRDEFAASAVSIGDNKMSGSGMMPKKLSYRVNSAVAVARCGAIRSHSSDLVKLDRR